MTPDRRTFLRLLAAGAISPLVDVDRLLWVPGAKTWFLPPAKKPLSTLWGLTEEMVRLVTAKMERPLLFLGDDDYKLGSAVVGGALIDGWEATSLIVDESDRWVQPCADALAQQINRSRYDVSVSPKRHDSIESAVVTDPISGVSIRGITMYSYIDGAKIARFDFLGGHRQ